MNVFNRLEIDGVTFPHTTNLRAFYKTCGAYEHFEGCIEQNLLYIVS